MHATTIPKEHIQAYLETDYIVHTDQPLKLRIAKPNSEIQKLHKQHRVECSAFITAFNLYPQSCNLDDNLARQHELIAELKSRSLKFIEGIGQHSSKDWPCEPSLLVLGLSLEAAKILGSRFKQNALIWIGSDAIPELVLLRYP